MLRRSSVVNATREMGGNSVLEMALFCLGLR
jgi:hypothetical protein